jgi:hypothetical protein
MTEQDYISALRATWPRTHSHEVSLETMALADEAIREFPQSPRLLVMRGDLIQLNPENTPQTLQDALASYQRAVEIDPKFAEAWEEIGHFHDVVLADEKTAQTFFDKARQLRVGHAA